MATDGFRFVDLFAGLGGFHVALSGLGGRAVFAAEWDPTLNSLYEVNFGLPAWKDVNDLGNSTTIAQAVPDHDVLTAGFPCQPFSKAGEQLGFSHTLQGQLFFRVLDILREKRPRYFILENVPNILRHQNGLTLETMKRELKALGYHVDVKKFSPHEFGVPQIRERAYFVGSLSSTQITWPTPARTGTDVASVLDVHASPPRAIPEQTQHAINMWDDFLRRSPKTTKLPSFPIWSMEFGADYPFEDATPPALWDEGGAAELDDYRGVFGAGLTGLTREEQFSLIPSHSRRTGDFSFPRWKKTFISQNREFFWENRSWIVPWMEQWRPWDLPSSLQKFEWNAQGGRRTIDDYILQVRASGLRVKRTTTAPSLIAMTQTQVPILGANLVGARRYMTPSECARLQSLEQISLPTSDLQAYKALGNAVNATVVQAIAEPLIAEMYSRVDFQHDQHEDQVA